MTGTEQELYRIFGFEAFREGQAQVVEHLLTGGSSLAVFPTGSGKSLCYQFTATQLPHLTLVISPLIALMQDQLSFLHSKGIAAARLDSTQSREESLSIMAEVKAGKIKILMISVERFKNENFRRFIQQVAISLMVVDEAHCISEWGHNFRPDYLKLPQYQASLKIPQVLLLTATATRRVQKDMAQKFAIQPQQIVQTGFYRHNLHLQLIPVNEQQKFAQLETLLAQQAGASIVYVTLQKTAEQLAQQLKDKGHRVQAYHAGLDSEKRQQIQTDFMQGRTPIIIATIAFGMGIDKSDIRLVVHYDLPKSIENYSQEIGRAGRDQQASQCVLLGNLNGLNTLENFVYGDTPEAHSIHHLIQLIQQQSHQGEWQTQLYHLSIDTNIRNLALKTLLVQLELMGVIEAKYSYYAEIKVKWLTEPEHFIQGLSNEWQASFQRLQQGIQYKKIWGNVDLQWLNHHLGMQRAEALTLLEFAAEQDAIVLDMKGVTEVYHSRIQDFDTQAVNQHLLDYVQQKEASEIERIATMIRFFELDLCLNHNLARYFGDQNAPEQCGHCSVCQGHIMRFEQKNQDLSHFDPRLQQDIGGFVQQVQQLSRDTKITPTLITRFLTGLTQPIFSRIKARQLAGFGDYEEESYPALLAYSEGYLLKQGANKSAEHQSY
ncbi:RecQ family ATP-dependent DNA helicase [Marinomonas sp. THO17]|uniref:RecQ family ATP-dependent DNA helicase n=1 Tax=Marinomonas sp. THO17 TaxID=3149048 RepID=UPI00336C1DC4